eukprot:SAG31_NODE_7086_length_1793_cov_1.806966_2_plen_107_part_00
MQRKVVEEASKSSTIPVKIPKMPGSWDDISSLLNAEKSETEDSMPATEISSDNAASSEPNGTKAPEPESRPRTGGFFSSARSMTPEEMELAKQRRDAQNRAKIEIQ